MLINKGKYFILVIAIIWFVLNELLPTINMPEFSADEAIIGVGVLQLIKNETSSYDVNILGRHFPIAGASHHGALEYYLLFPFLFFGGATLEALRTGPLFWGVIILALTYYFASEFFNPIVGVLSVVLLAVNSFFIILTKMGGRYGFSMPIFTVVPLLFFYKWHNTRKNLYFYLGMFLLGLGFNGKGWFIWFIISLFLNAIVLYVPRNKIRIKTLLIGLVWMFLSLMPIIYSDFKYGGYLRKLAYRDFIITEFGINNLEVAKNLSIRVTHLNSILMGPGGIGNSLKMFQIYFFWICLIWLFYLIFVRKITKLWRNKIIFLLSLFSITFIMTAFTFTWHLEGHLNILFPHIQILMAVAIFEIFHYIRHNYRIVISLLVTMLFVVNIARCVETYNNLKNEGKNKSFCNMHMVSKWVLENKIHNITGFNFLTHSAVRFYSNLKISPFCMCIDLNPYFFDYLRRLIINATSDKVFIFDVNNDAKEYEAFKRLSQELNKEIVIRKRFLWSNGDARFLIISLK